MRYLAYWIAVALAMASFLLWIVATTNACAATRTTADRLGDRTVAALFVKGMNVSMQDPTWEEVDVTVMDRTCEVTAPGHAACPWTLDVLTDKGVRVYHARGTSEYNHGVFHLNREVRRGRA